jgi:outer membrane protein OmpA-like peptidoglycan-associated protein
VSPGVPIEPPAAVMNGDAVGAVMVAGNMDSSVVFVRTPTNSGWSAQGTNFELSVDTENASGSPMPLTPSGVMQVPVGGLITINGYGYQPQTPVAVFAIPRSAERMGGRVLSSAMSSAIYIASTTVNRSGGVSAVMQVPAEMIVGDYVLQINGETLGLQIRSVNLLLDVVPAPVAMRAEVARESAFYEGKSARLSANGKAKLALLVTSIPADAQNVSVVIVGVSVGLDSLDTNLDLARDRAKGVTKYLKKQGVNGNYTVSVYTNFTVDTDKRGARSVDTGSPSIAVLEAPATSRAGKPLTTASISFEVPAGT